MNKKCAVCGRDLDCRIAGECWSDNSNALTHPHLGGVKCRECYGKTHNFCPKCDAPLLHGWLYCPKCGEKINVTQA